MEKALKKLLPAGTFGSITPARSRAMRAVRGRGNRTTEQRFRFALVGAGIRGWTTHNRGLLGTPDFVFAKAKLAVFVDGCFWHGCPVCGHIPRTRRPYWEAKIARNRKRDRSVTRRLRAMGFRVLRFWEHDLHHLEHCVEQVLRAVEDFPSYLLAEGISDCERKAVARVRRAGVSAPVSAVLSWVRSTGADSFLSARLSDILTVANAF